MINIQFPLTMSVQFQDNHRKGKMVEVTCTLYIHLTYWYFKSIPGKDVTSNFPNIQYCKMTIVRFEHILFKRLFLWMIFGGVARVFIKRGLFLVFSFVMTTFKFKFNSSGMKTMSSSSMDLQRHKIQIRSRCSEE